MHLANQLVRHGHIVVIETKHKHWNEALPFALSAFLIDINP